MIKNRLFFDFSDVYDFIGCMFRISFYDTYKKTLESLESVHGDEFLQNTVEAIRKDMDNTMFRDFEFFVDNETAFAAGILAIAVEKNIKTQENLIEQIDAMDSEILISYLAASDNGLTLRDIREFKADYNKLYKYIENNVKYTDQNKWRLAAIISDPDKYKARFTDFIKNFYRQHYSKLKEISAANIKEKSRDILRYIEEDPAKRVKDLTLINMEKDNSRRVIIGFSYFSEFGMSIVDSPATNTSIVIMGTRHIEMLRINSMESLSDENIIEIFKVVGDKTRIEILKMMKGQPVYGTQIAEKFNMSNPAVSYHMDQLFAAGLVTVEKQGHRLYYYLKPERLEQVIKYLRNFIKES